MALVLFNQRLLLTFNIRKILWLFQLKISRNFASIHCSYYATLQYMKYVLANTDKRAIPYSSQDVRGQDSHNHILTEIVNRIDDYRNGRLFREDVRWLKSERKEADYTQRDFNQKESLECIDKAKGIICKLNQYFGL